jgi:membrane protein required for colicin V production
MNFIDLVFIVPIVWYAYKGFTKGFVLGIATLIALILGIYVAKHFSIYAAEFFHNTLNITNKYMNIISFIVTFLLVIILVILLGKSIEKLVKATKLGLINRLAGGALGIFKVVLILSTILLILNAIKMDDVLISKETKDSSLLYRPVEKVAPFIFPRIKEIREEIKEKNTEPQ